MSLLSRWPCGALLLCLLLSVLVPSAAHAAARRIVLAVGSNQGLDAEYPLRFAAQDAERFAQVMAELGDVRREDVHLLANPSKRDFLQAVAWVRERSAPDVTLVVYFSGHGSALAVHVRGEQLNLSELQAALNAIPAQFRLLLVDACRGEARKGFQPDPESFEIGIGSPTGGVVSIHSTGPGEISVESNELEAGVFSHLFMSGLRGPADANHDRAISVQEAYEYARLHRLDWDSPAPDMQGSAASTGAVTLTNLDTPHSLLVLPPGSERYRVYEAGGVTELVRAWASPAAPTRVALPGDHFVVYRGAGAARQVAEVAIPFGGTRALEPADFRARPEGQVKGWFDDDAGAGSVRQHELGLAAGTRIASNGGMGPAAALSYAHGLTGWGPTIGVATSRQRAQSIANWTQRDELELAAGARYAQHFSSLTVTGGLAATTTLVRQTLISRGTDSAGLRLRDESSAVGYGLSAAGNLRLPLSSWLSSNLTVAGSLTLLRQKGTEGAQPGVSLDSSLVVGIGLSTSL